MTQITNLEEIKSIVSREDALLIYFSGNNCSVCTSLKPKIDYEVSINYPKIKLFEVKADIYKEIASNFLVFSIPTILVFFDSKEFRRYGRNISIPFFLEDLKRPYTLFME